MNYYSLIPLSSFLINAILASVVLMLNPKSSKNRAFALFAFFCAIWGFFNFLEWNEKNNEILTVLLQIEVFIWLPIVFLVLNFIYTLIGKKYDIVFWIVGGMVGVWLFVSLFVNGYVSVYRPTYWGVIDILHPFYYLALLCANFLPALYVFWLLHRTIKKTSDPQLRVHLQYLFIGTAIMYALVMFESVIKNAFLHIDTIPFLGAFLTIIQSGFVFVSIVRHEFLTVNIRSAAMDIFSQVNEGVIILDLNGWVREINPPARDLFDVQETECSINPLESQVGYSRFENFMSREFTFISKNQNVMCIVSQSELRDAGKKIGTLIILHNVTQLRLEEKRSRVLEEQVGRSHASRLEALGQLSGGIAHDFNNIIAGVCGYSSLLARKLSSQDQQLVGFAKSINDLALRAGSLTKKLLTFARKTPIEMVPLDIHELITETCSLLKHTVERNISISCKLLAKSKFVRGDVGQLENMIINVALNARDAMPDGGSISLSTNVESISEEYRHLNGDVSAAGEYSVISITDTGCGMNEEIRHRIFEPFFTTKDPGKGTGLGLASVYGIVRMHNGFLKVDSVLGKGTTFYLYIPLISSHDFSALSQVHEPPKGSGRILFVDDEEALREAIPSMLVDLEYTVEVGANGVVALEIYKAAQNQFDLVILDIIMPEMNGIVCAEKLREINPDVKILFITGFSGKIGTFDNTDEHFEANGPVLVKPFSLFALANSVHNAVAARP